MIQHCEHFAPYQDSDHGKYSQPLLLPPLVLHFISVTGLKMITAHMTSAFSCTDHSPLHVTSPTSLFNGVHNFQKGIKHDIMLYPRFKHDRPDDSWYSETHAIASMHGTETVFNPNYSTTETSQVLLWVEFTQFMFTVFCKNLQTSVDHMLISTKVLNAIFMYETGRADVSGFHKDLGQLKEAKIATVAVAYNNESTGETMLLIFHQVLYLPGLDHHLLNPFQTRQNGITINDIPLLHVASEDRNMESHSIITNQKELIIPLQLNGIFISFKVHAPLEQEVNELFGESIQMTLDSILWDPSVGDYNQDEEQLTIDEIQGILKPTRNRKIQTMNSHLHPIELPDIKINRNFDSSFHFLLSYTSP